MHLNFTSILLLFVYVSLVIFERMNFERRRSSLFLWIKLNVVMANPMKFDLLLGAGKMYGVLHQA